MRWWLSLRDGLLKDFHLLRHILIMSPVLDHKCHIALKLKKKKQNTHTIRKGKVTKNKNMVPDSANFLEYEDGVSSKSWGRFKNPESSVQTVLRKVKLLCLPTDKLLPQATGKTYFNPRECLKPPLQPRHQASWITGYFFEEKEPFFCL